MSWLTEVKFVGNRYRCENDEDDHYQEKCQAQNVSSTECLPRRVCLFFIQAVSDFFDEVWDMFDKHESLLRTPRPFSALDEYGLAVAVCSTPIIPPFPAVEGETRQPEKVAPDSAEAVSIHSWNRTR